MKSFCRFFPLLWLLAPIAMFAAPAPKIISRAEWQALEARPFRGQKPVRITIHHSAVHFTKERDAATHIKNIQTWGMGEARNWTDIPYHFIIDPKGNIFEGRDMFTEGESNTSYDTSGHLQINLLGNFNEQEPTEEQLQAAVALIAWASHKHGIPIETIKAHKDFASTQCPGENLYRLVENGHFQREAAKLLQSKKNRPQIRGRR